MTLDATVSGLQGLVNGDYDQTDEQAFYLIGDLSTLKESETETGNGSSWDVSASWPDDEGDATEAGAVQSVTLMVTRNRIS